MEKIIDTKTIDGYMSVEKQKDLLNSFIDSNLYERLINNCFNNIDSDNIYITSDTHDDYFSLLGSLIESGIVQIEKEQFKYYDIKDMDFIEYNKITKINEKNIIVIFEPIILDKMPCGYQLCPTGPIYHLKLVFEKNNNNKNPKLVEGRKS